MNTITSPLYMAIGAAVIGFSVIKVSTQKNFIRFIFYQMLAQSGYVFIGFATATAAGRAGAIFHLVNSAIFLSIFILIGLSIKYRAGSLNFDKLANLPVRMPITAFCCLIASLAISGIPPFNGFFSLWMICQGILLGIAGPGPRFTVFLCLIVVLYGTAATLDNFLKMTRTIFFKENFIGGEKDKIS